MSKTWNKISVITAVYCFAGGVCYSESIKKTIYRIAKEEGVSGRIVYAIAMQESGLNTKAKGDYRNGKPTAFGIVQIRPICHPTMSVKNCYNVEKSIRYLCNHLKKGPTWLQVKKWNGWGKMADRYVQKIKKRTR